MTFNSLPKILRGYGGSNVFTEKNLEDMSPQEYQDYFNKVRTSFGRNEELNALNPSKSKTGSSSASSSSNSSSFLLDKNSLDDATTRAKDLASFRLGLDKDQASFSGGLRETEAQNNFGRQTKATDQTYGWESKINDNTQAAQTGRLQRQLDATAAQQQADIGQQNLSTNRAINLASRRLGAR